jgi:hypothetical protein
MTIEPNKPAKGTCRPVGGFEVWFFAASLGFRERHAPYRNDVITAKDGASVLPHPDDKKPNSALML